MFKKANVVSGTDLNKIKSFKEMKYFKVLYKYIINLSTKGDYL